MKAFLSNIFGGNQQQQQNKNVEYGWICNKCFVSIKEGECRYRSMDRKGVDLCINCYKEFAKDAASLPDDEFNKKYAVIKAEKGSENLTSSCDRKEWYFCEPLHSFRLKYNMINAERSCQTVARAFLSFAERPCFGIRKGNKDAWYYEWHSYAQVFEQIVQLSFAIEKIIAKEPKQPIAHSQQKSADSQQESLHFIAICAKNREEYFIADYALLLKNIVSVPVHFTLIPGDMEHIIDNAKCCAVFTGSSDLTQIYIDLKKSGKCPTLKHIIQFDSCQEQVANNNSYTIHDYSTLLAKEQKSASKLLSPFYTFYKNAIASLTKGSSSSSLLNPQTVIQHMDRIVSKLCVVPKSDQQIVTLIYTSGSTGKPKGVIITDSAWNKSVCNSVPCDPYIVISFAPLAHMSDRKHVLLSICNGGRTGIFMGEMENIFEDIKLVKPTIIVSTPRLWVMLHGHYLKMLEAEKQGALNKLKQEEEAGGESSSSTELSAMESNEIEKRVMAEFASILGGRIQMIVTGGAATSDAVLTFLKKCFKCHINDGYGATEVGGIMDNGYIKHGVIFKLISVPEMGYLTSDKPYPRGEFCVKTETMFAGYFGNEELTRSQLDEEGFYHSGDIVELQGEKKIRIIDRIKNIFKLAQGEFIAPERLESVFVQSSYIDNIFVYGNSVKSYLIAVVIPNLEKMREWVKKQQVEKNVSDHDDDDDQFKQWLKEHANLPQLQQLFLNECIALAKGDGGSAVVLQNYEIPRRFVIDTRPFTIENDMLTASFKLRRVNCEGYYKKQLESLYAEMEKEEAKALEQDLTQLVSSTLGGEDTMTTTISNSSSSLSSLGIDSLHAVKIASMIKSKYQVDVPLKMLFAPTANLADLSTFIMSKQQGGTSNSNNNNHLQQVQQQTNIADQVQICMKDFAAFAATQSFDKNKPTSCIPLKKSQIKYLLLTGCTGFLGSFLLFDLLQAYCTNSSTHVIIYCIVRAKNNQLAQERVIESLLEHKLIEQLQACNKHATVDETLNWLHVHVKALAGDCGTEKTSDMGLAPSDYNLLKDNVQVIFHNAAHVNALLGYEQLKSSNVTATLNVLKLAYSKNELKHVYHISTIGVVQGFKQAKVLEESVPLEIHNAILSASGYSQSKFVAEMLVHQVAAQYHIPTIVFRPGMIGPDTVNGMGNDNDWVVRLIRGCIMLGYYPDTNHRELDWIPVNDASRAIVECCNEASELVFTRSSKQKTTYHLCNGKKNAIELEKIFSTIATCTEYKMERISFKKWRALIEEQVNQVQQKEDPKSKKLFAAYWPLLTLFKGEVFPQAGGTFDNAQLVARLAECSKHQLSVIDEKYITRLVKTIMQ